jgi:hypothetical protein
MKASDEEPRPHMALAAKMQAAGASIYLTMLSIIQGVVLADLAGVVAGNYPHFTAVQWILVVTQFCIIAETWTQFMTDFMTNATAKGWIPGYADSVFFFGLGAGELFLNHAIVIGLTTWLVGMMGAAVAEFLIVVFIRRREQGEMADPVLVHMLERRNPQHRRHAAAGAIAFLIAFLACLIGGVDSGDTHGSKAMIAVGSAVLSAVWVGALIAITATHWQRMVRYVRTGEEPERVLLRLQSRG